MSVINTNVAANTAFRNLGISSKALQGSIEKLSSGFRINKSGDDAAGLSIANKLRADIRSLQQASRNAEQAGSLLQIADGAVNTISSILDRLKELATQANSANVGDQAPKLTAEFTQLVSEIERIAQTTKFNGTGLVNGGFGTSLDKTNSTAFAVAGSNVADIKLNGTAAGTFTITNPAAGSLTVTDANSVAQTVTGVVAGRQTLTFSTFGISIETDAAFAATGADLAGKTVIVTQAASASFQVSSSGAFGGNDLVSVNAIDLTSGATGVDLAGLDLNSATNAQTALARIDTAIGKVQDAIGSLGAAQNRISFASSNVSSLIQNTIAAESTIRDADVAFETTQFTKNQILQQAGTAVLAQANQAPQALLSLLR